MVRVGVIGCGYWGPNLVRVFHECPATEVKAVCDSDVARIAEMQARYPSTEGHRDSEDLIRRDDIDLVVVATPLSSHFPIAKRAIAAGKHVLIEKPITETSEQAEELIDLAEREGVLLAVDHTFLFTPAVEKMKSLIDSGRIGAINYIDSVRINLGLIHDEINVIWDLAPHDLSIIDYLLGKPPLSVNAVGACHTCGGQVDVAYINLDYGNGLIAHFHLNWLSPVKVRRMIIGGDRQMIIFDDLSNSEKVRVYDSGMTTVAGEDDNGHKRARRIDLRTGDIWTPHLARGEALTVQAAHIASAVTNGTPLRADGAAGCRVVRLLEACHDSLLGDGIRVCPSFSERFSSPPAAVAP